jgi:hypothetical protein
MPDLVQTQLAVRSERRRRIHWRRQLDPATFLHTALTLPARTPRDIFAVCDPVRALTPEEQPVLHEDLSEVQGGDRFGRIELRLRRAGPGRYLRELVTGHSGCGKSTELLRLASALRIPKDGAAFHVVYVDANASLSPHEARLPQLLVALLAALAEEPRWDLRATRSGPPLWERFRRIVGGLSEVAGELANAAGFPQLRALLKIDLNLARGFRKAAQDHLQSLISGTQDLIAEVTRALPSELGAIVFILDNILGRGLLARGARDAAMVELARAQACFAACADDDGEAAATRWLEAARRGDALQ